LFINNPILDLIVGAYANDQSNKSLAGRSYVVFGKQDNTNAIELSAIAAGTGGFIINGESANDYSGWSVSNAGDVNDSPLITKPSVLVPAAMADKLMASVLSCL
jgi:hypothetical protein